MIEQPRPDQDVGNRFLFPLRPRDPDEVPMEFRAQRVSLGRLQGGRQLFVGEQQARMTTAQLRERVRGLRRETDRGNKQ